MNDDISLVPSPTPSLIPSLVYDATLAPHATRIALIWGFGLPACPQTVSPPEHLSELLDRVRIEGDAFIAPERKAAVRGMLRFGAYKPSGRAKPSSEYLFSAALKEDFPLVNGPVDVNNAISLETGYPASIFDLDLCGRRLLLRRGRPGESYVFNSSGQTIDLEDLLCVCRSQGNEWLPCGNPVKDAMSTKIRPTTTHVVAVIYAPIADSADLDAAAARFAALLRSECRATESGWSAQ